MKVDMRSPTPMQSMKTTHSSSLSVSRTPMSSTRPKPIVDTAGERNKGMVSKCDCWAGVGKLKNWWGHKGLSNLTEGAKQRCHNSKSLPELLACWYHTEHVRLILQIPECSVSILAHHLGQRVQLKDITTTLLLYWRYSILNWLAVKLAVVPWLCPRFFADSTAEPDAEQDQEGRVVTGPLVLGLFPVVEVAVDPLWRREQVEHLPQGKLKVHLPHVEQPPQVLVSLGTGRVARRIPGARCTVAMRRGGRQHGAGPHNSNERRTTTMRWE